MFEVLERDKLDDVTEDRLAFGRTQDPIVPVKDLHVGEVSVAHSNDDDGHGQVRGVHNGLPCVRHVGDDAVRQDQQDEVFLTGRKESYGLKEGSEDRKFNKTDHLNVGSLSGANLNTTRCNPPESLKRS